jgi:hypothetical protein
LTVKKEEIASLHFSAGCFFAFFQGEAHRFVHLEETLYNQNKCSMI